MFLAYTIYENQIKTLAQVGSHLKKYTVSCTICILTNIW